MKKTILGLILFGAIWAAFSLLSGPYNTQSFINGTAVVIEQPASATALSVSGTSTSIKYTNDLSQLITAGTNAAGITYGAWARPVVIRSDAIGAAAVYSISTTLAAGTTNTVTFTFQRSIDGSNFDAGFPWSFTTPSDLGLTGQTMITNIPTWLVVGASHLRCSSISYATNTHGYTNALTSLRFNGFAP